MSTSPATVAHLLDLLAGAGEVTARKMFGEYAVYLGGRVVALVCDDRLYVKPTPGARAALAGAPESPPYPGAKPHLAPDTDAADPDALARALRAVASETPVPKPRRKPGRPA